MQATKKRLIPEYLLSNILCIMHIADDAISNTQNRLTVLFYQCAPGPFYSQPARANTGNLFPLTSR